MSKQQNQTNHKAKRQNQLNIRANQPNTGQNIKTKRQKQYIQSQKAITIKTEPDRRIKSKAKTIINLNRDNKRERDYIYKIRHRRKTLTFLRSNKIFIFFVYLENSIPKSSSGKARLPKIILGFSSYTYFRYILSPSKT